MGYRIKEEREAQGMTQEELAEKSGVSRVTISLIESGRNTNVMIGTLAKIAMALGKSVDEIFFTNAVKPT